ncbi:MAG: TetR/AcrR family transcriptional regulator [Lachnospiraceae bacterium]|nr:TetR/AcrR family transcriptional regulator [Lachnospiraceae bacterium]
MERRDVIRSKERLREAYLGLLLEKGETKITVNEVLQKADLSRGTFYAHYKDIDDLHNAVEEQLIERWRKTFKDPSLKQFIDSPREPLDGLLARIEPHKREMQILLKKQNGSNLIQRAKHAMITLMIEESGLEDTPELLLLRTTIAGGVIDAFVLWVMTDNALPREILVEKMCNFVSSGIRGWNVQE